MGNTLDGLQHRPCPVCDQDDADAHWSKGPLQLVQCRACGMVYADPIASSLTSGAFYHELAQPFYLSREKLESDYASVRFARELRLFRAYCRQGRVLDVGCSTGAFLYQLAQRWPGSYETLGTDIATEALDYAASRGVAVARESFLAYQPAEAFDAITFWAVLEHLAAPRRFLAKAAQLLKTGGYCFILVPNFRSLAVRLLGRRYRYILVEHVNYFNVTTLERFVATESTLRVVNLDSTHFNPVVLWQDWRKPCERVPDNERAHLLARTTAWKQNRLLAPLRWLYQGTEKLLGRLRLADNLVVVLQKKS